MAQDGEGAQPQGLEGQMLLQLIASLNQQNLHSANNTSTALNQLQR